MLLCRNRLLGTEWTTLYSMAPSNMVIIELFYIIWPELLISWVITSNLTIDLPTFSI